VVRLVSRDAASAGSAMGVLLDRRRVVMRDGSDNT
jgi:hypothetical protein